MSFSTNKAEIVTTLTGYTDLGVEFEFEDIEGVPNSKLHKVYQIVLNGSEGAFSSNNIVSTSMNVTLRVRYNNRADTYENNADAFDTICRNIAKLNGYADVGVNYEFELEDNYFSLGTFNFMFGKYEG